LVKLTLFVIFKLYRITWRYVGLNDLFNTLNAVVLSEAILMVLILMSSSRYHSIFPRDFFSGFPRSVFIIDGVLSFFLLSGFRISRRVLSEIVLQKKKPGKEGKRTIIIGAGNTGEMILRDMSKLGHADFYPVAILDDNPEKIGTYIHGVKVLATTKKLRAAVLRYGAEAVIIAIPSLNYNTLRNIYNLAKKSKVKTIKIVPRIYDFHNIDVNPLNLEEIRIEDLIGRQTVEIDYQEIEKFLKDRAVLITGAGGSIGFEIVMQVCGFYPAKVILFEIDETELHNLELKLKGSFPHLIGNVHFVVGDIRDSGRVDEVFRTFHPEIVFHAAAYKHVPMLEYNPGEAVKVNIFGTYNLAAAAVRYGVKKFVMISTDKVVMPTSIMGATKRLAEKICSAYNVNGSNATEFVSVRFGNVLGSRGSVLPLFLEQLKNGGPITITHREMQRYFMTIPEAVSLVLQASVMGKRGEVLALDMGKPVKIVEMAEELIRLHGLEPYRDIGIEFTGIRHGEKLFEELLTAEEGTTATKHEKIFIAKNSQKYNIQEIESIIGEFQDAVSDTSGENKTKIKTLLKKYVTHFEDAVH
jgi:FlaA1/EpsC-like NDP-sugar epimerase